GGTVDPGRPGLDRPGRHDRGNGRNRWRQGTCAGTGAVRARRLHTAPNRPILQKTLTTHKAHSCHPSGYVPGSCTCRRVHSSSWEPSAPYPPADATTAPTSCVGTPTASCSTPEKAPNDRCTRRARQPPTSSASPSPTPKATH